MLGVGQLECISYDIVCGVSYCVDNEKALISEEDCQEHNIYLNVSFDFHSDPRQRFCKAQKFCRRKLCFRSELEMDDFNH